MMRVPADSYVSVADADAYHAIRPSGDLWASLTGNQKEMRLVAASDYIDARYRLRDDLNHKMRVADAEIIEPVRKAVCELALKTGLYDNETQKRTAVKVGDISVSYDKNSGSRFEYIDALLAPYVNSSLVQIQVVRG